MSKAEYTVTLEEGWLTISLNRPKALNALSLDMIHGIRSAVTRLEQDPAIRGLSIRSETEKAFCAGGDVRSVYEAATALRQGHKPTFQPARYFAAEYAMNRALYRLSKPFHAIVTGYVMGGGYGLCLSADRIETDASTLFAMPEVKIGLFPDVGSTYQLAALPNQWGTYLALTGRQITGVQMAEIGLAHHTFPHAAPPPSELSANASAIETHFGHNSVVEIFASLQKDSASWAQEAIEAFHTASPISLAMTLKHLRMAEKDRDFENITARDFELARICTRPGSDFLEGVRALLVDKDKKPNWHLSSLEEAEKEVNTWGVFRDS